ncbi:MAG: tetratricopeptide repeat protein [Bacteroidales bacterium]|nr:tetratricopeptide repeat protein [Bacteroidales bacterium]
MTKPKPGKPAAGRPASEKKTHRLALTVILSLTLLLFAGTLGNGILYGWDDGEYIENEEIRGLSFQNASKYFSTYYLGMYQPLAVLSLAVNHALSGDRPGLYHAVNLALHLICVWLVFAMVLRLTGKWLAAATASLLFAIHPMHVEAVAWIATRSNGLYSAFYLGALLVYTHYLRKRKTSGLLFTMLLFLASLFSKSMAVTLPLVMILMDYFILGRPDRSLWIQKIPFLALSVIFGLVSIDAASDYGHIKNLIVDYHPVDRILLLCYALTFYLIRLIVPVNLSAIYAYPAKEGAWLPFEYYIAPMILIVLAVVLWKSGRYRRELMFGTGFFLITLSVVLPVVWSRMFMMADRYTYIPYTGIFFLAGLWFDRLISGRELRHIRIRPVLLLLFAGYLVFLGATTVLRIRVWQDAETLTTDVIHKNRSDVDVSIGYFFRGNIRDRNGDFQGSYSDFNRAIALNPGYTMAYNNRGIIRGIMKDYEGALEDFSKAIELEPGYADAWYNRGNARYYLEFREEACGDWKQAVALGSVQAQKILKKYCPEK